MIDMKLTQVLVPGVKAVGDAQLAFNRAVKEGMEAREAVQFILNAQCGLILPTLAPGTVSPVTWVANTITHLKD